MGMSVVSFHTWFSTGLLFIAKTRNLCPWRCMGCCIGCMDFSSLNILIFILSPTFACMPMSMFSLSVVSSWMIHLVLSVVACWFIILMVSSHSMGCSSSFSSQLPIMVPSGILWQGIPPIPILPPLLLLESIDSLRL